MRRFVRISCVVAVATPAGCASIPPLENPALVRPGPSIVENPVILEPGMPTPEGYREVYERVLDVVDDYFEIKPSSRYSGQIDTLPRIAPGYEQWWKPGSPDARERLLATFQTIRHRAVVHIWAGERGGYRVYVEVYKELEDLGTPSAARYGSATFREAPTVERQLEIATVQSSAPGWIPQGRDPAFEQVILRKIQTTSCRSSQ